jgi:uncharacterized protein
VIRKAIIVGALVFFILLLINAGIGGFITGRIIDQSKESVSIISVFTQLSRIRVSISEFYNVNGELPESNKELGIGSPESLAERWVKSVTIGPAGRIDALLKGEEGDRHIYLYAFKNPVMRRSPLDWRCYAKGIKQSLLDTIPSPSCILLASNENPPVPEPQKKPTVDALIKAVRKKSNGLIKIMTKNKGVDVNGRNANGESPLRVAIEHSADYSVQLLASAGANVNEVILDQNKKTLLMLATENRVHGGLKVRTLLEYGATIDARDGAKRTPLIHAAINNDIESVRALMEEGADISLIDHKGQTAKDYASLLHGKDSRVYRRLALKKPKQKQIIYLLPKN